MKRIIVSNRVQIKQLLYCDRVLAVRDDACPAFGGFALWWYDKKHGVCRCCRSHWSDRKKQIEAHTLDRAAAILWRDRDALLLRDRRLSDDHKLMQINHLCNWRPNTCGLRLLMSLDEQDRQSDRAAVWPCGTPALGGDPSDPSRGRLGHITVG